MAQALKALAQAAAGRARRLRSGGRAGAFSAIAAACAAGGADAPRALILFYRSIYLANDLAPVDALGAALAAARLRRDRRRRSPA